MNVLLVVTGLFIVAASIVQKALRHKQNLRHRTGAWKCPCCGWEMQWCGNAGAIVEALRNFILAYDNGCLPEQIATVYDMAVDAVEIGWNEPPSLDKRQECLGRQVDA
jgi:hypothetical protein